jgi:NAD-dependent DNA ligase
MQTVQWNDNLSQNNDGQQLPKQESLPVTKCTLANWALHAHVLNKSDISDRTYDHWQSRLHSDFNKTETLGNIHAYLVQDAGTHILA